MSGAPLSWQVGDVSITRIVEMKMNVAHDPERAFIAEATPEALRRHAWLYPDFVTADDAMRLSIHALLVEAPGVRMVVDTCIGNDKPRSFVGRKPLATAFLSDLAAVGWAPETVDVVVCTHLHVDHVGWNTMLVDGRWVPTFPNARYLIGRTELAHWQAERDAEQQAILADSVQPILDAGLAELVEMDHRISPELRLVPTAGHTPGHVSVAITSRGASAVITGDMTHHPCQLAHPEWSPVFDCDRTAAAVTRRALFEAWAGTDTLVIGTHYAAPTAGRVVRDGAGFRLQS